MIDFYIYDMSNIVNDFNLGTIKITQSYNIDALPSDSDATPYLNQVDEELIVSFIELDRVTKFTKFSYSANGLLQSRYIDTSYRISRNGNTWTDWFTLTQNGFTETEIDNFPPFDPLDQMWIDIKFTRKGTKTDGSIRLLSFELDGELLQNDSDGTVIVSPGKEAIIKPPYIYKVFRIDDIEILSPNSIVDIEFNYRFSQDNTRTWSDWEPLTKENISTKRINPIRFFQVQYLIKNNSNSSVKIQDINLIGDFQNVSLDYQKTNLYGIRDCCQSYLLGGLLS